MTISATILLDQVFVNLASDYTQSIVCGSAGGVGGGGQRSDNYSQQGDFRNYANANTRLILGTANNRTLTIALRALTPAQLTTLQSFLGKTILIRDTYGRKMWGSFTQITMTDIPLSGAANTVLLTDAQINFTVVSYTEGV